MTFRPRHHPMSQGTNEECATRKNHDRLIVCSICPATHPIMSQRKELQSIVKLGKHILRCIVNNQICFRICEMLLFMNNHNMAALKIPDIIGIYIGCKRRPQQKKGICLLYLRCCMGRQAAVKLLSVKRHIRPDYRTALLAIRYFFAVPDIFHRIFFFTARANIMIDRTMQI